MESTIIPDVTAEVEVPGDGTLSRVLYKDDHIRLVAFAFDAGQELTEHTAAVPAILQVLQGRFRITLSERVVDDAGAAFWAHLPAGLPHSVLALEPGVLLLTLLRA